MFQIDYINASSCLSVAEFLLDRILFKLSCSPCSYVPSHSHSAQSPPPTLPALIILATSWSIKGPLYSCLAFK